MDKRSLERVAGVLGDDQQAERSHVPVAALEQRVLGGGVADDVWKVVKNAGLRHQHFT